MESIVVVIVVVLAASWVGNLWVLDRLQAGLGFRCMGSRCLCLSMHIILQITYFACTSGVRIFGSLGLDNYPWEVANQSITVEELVKDTPKTPLFLWGLN